MLSEKCRSDILSHAAREYPRESCGVIVGGTYFPCANISASDSQFEISPVDIVKAGAIGMIEAYVHSHPDGTTTPSIPDKIQMANHGLPWVITDGVNVDVYEPDEYRAPLLSREYYHGLLDCYTLVKDYYGRELGIDLSDYSRDDLWWEDRESEPLYLNNFASEGFVEVSTVQKHDVILCRLGRTEHVNHAAVFVGDGDLRSEAASAVVGDSLILHHPYGRPALREIYGELWRRRTAMVIRHKSMF